MQTTVRELKKRLRKELRHSALKGRKDRQRELRDAFSCFPNDGTIIEYEEAAVGLDKGASLLFDVLDIVPAMHTRYGSTARVAWMLRDQGILRMLLSRWKHRMDYLREQFIPRQTAS